MVTFPPARVTAAIFTSMVSNTAPSVLRMVILPVPFWMVSPKVRTRLAFRATPKRLSLGEKVGTSGGLLPVEKAHVEELVIPANGLPPEVSTTAVEAIKTW